MGKYGWSSKAAELVAGTVPYTNRWRMTKRATQWYNNSRGSTALYWGTSKPKPTFPSPFSSIHSSSTLLFHLHGSLFAIAKMRSGLLSYLTLWVTLVCSAVAQMKSVVVTYPDDVANSVIEKAKAGIVAQVGVTSSRRSSRHTHHRSQGGQITHEYGTQEFCKSSIVADGISSTADCFAAILKY